MDNGGDEGKQGGEAGFDQGCGNRVQQACGGLRFTDEVGYFRGTGELKGGKGLTAEEWLRGGERRGVRTELLVNGDNFIIKELHQGVAGVGRVKMGG